MSEPTTEAGRALLDRYPMTPAWFRKAILAIEAEAAQAWPGMLARLEKLEAVAAAAQAHIDWEYRKRGAVRFTLTDLRAAIDRLGEETP